MGGGAAIQSYLNRLEKREAQGDLMKFHKGKCKILLGKNHPMQHFRLEAGCLKSSFAEKDLGVLMYSKLSVSQQCALLIEKASGILEYIRKSTVISLRGVVFPLYSVPQLESWVPFRWICSLKFSDLTLFFYCRVTVVLAPAWPQDVFYGKKSSVFLPAHTGRLV